MSAYAIATLLGDTVPLAKARSKHDGGRRRCDSHVGERGVSKTTYNGQCDLHRYCSAPHTRFDPGFQHAVSDAADMSDDRDVIRFSYISHCADF